jgi:hypothetical protein
LLSIFLDPEYGGNMFLQKLGRFSADLEAVITQKMVFLKL